MPKRESTDAVGVEVNVGETKKESSMDSWPEIERETVRTTTKETTEDDNLGTARQTDESTGSDDDQNHGCDHDNAVPCRFQ